MDSPSDIDLIQKTLDGNLKAFDSLVRRYQDRLVHSLEHALGSREDAMDAAQQAFISAWRKLDSFRRDAGFYSWVYRIAMNAAISRKRKDRLATTSLDTQMSVSGSAPQDHSPEADPEQQLASEENTSLVRTALLELAEEFRQPLVMKEMDGFSYEQIAEILNIPLGTVRSRIFRARRELTEKLERVFRNR